MSKRTQPGSRCTDNSAFFRIAVLNSPSSSGFTWTFTSTMNIGPNYTPRMPETIGFIGLGLMGRPMATNLIKAGHSLIVHSRSPQPVDALVALGGKRGASPADIARQATRFVTMVPDSPDVEQVLEGDNGVFSALQRGTIIIDNSSIAPGVARRLAARAKSLGAQ